MSVCEAVCWTHIHTHTSTHTHMAQRVAMLSDGLNDQERGESGVFGLVFGTNQSQLAVKKSC